MRRTLPRRNRPALAGVPASAVASPAAAAETRRGLVFMASTAPARKRASKEAQSAPPPAAPEFVIRLLDPAALTAHPENWRRHPERQKEAIGASIAEFGWLASVLFNARTGHLLDGHARVELALAQGTDRLPVRVIDVPERTPRWPPCSPRWPRRARCRPAGRPPT